MKKIKLFLAILVTSSALLVLTGCGDPTKPAGPGGDRQQPYNPKDGTYK